LLLLSLFVACSQQLNFYSFRKIKFADTIRIDHKLEAETANYWKFRHENFRRGHPELLVKIKRMNGQKPSAKTALPDKAVSSPAASPTTAGVAGKAAEVTSSAEVLSLKKKIEEMSKNIDELTAMVQKVSLRQDEQEQQSDNADEGLGSKRKKVDPYYGGIESAGSSDSMTRPDVASSMIVDDSSSMPVDDMSEESMFTMVDIPEPAPLMKELSQSTTVSDTEFVDQLFSAFAEDGDDLFRFDEPTLDLPEEDTSSRPDPEMMKRLGDALMLLPRDIQEMIVDKLIAAITKMDIVAPLLTAAIEPEVVVSTKPKVAEALQYQTPVGEAGEKQEMSMPLAAATIAALLRHYSAQVGEKKQPKEVQKSLPVIPVHA
jgi:HSF-type DNA-binding